MEKKPINWKNIFSRLPLPMLAIAASYGVYSFAKMYVPEWVALSQAAAFELVYISLAIQNNLPEKLRKQATAISLGAVAVSILYNSISGYLHRNELLLDGGGRVAFEIIMAILHGAPLAGLAYLVSNLLLHTESPALPEVDVTDIVEAERAKYQILLEDKDRERDQLYENYQRELGKLQLALIEATAKPPEILEERIGPQISDNIDREALYNHAYGLMTAQNYSQRAAANAVNIPLSSFRDWLNKRKN